MPIITGYGPQLPLATARQSSVQAQTSRIESNNQRSSSESSSVSFAETLDNFVGEVDQSLKTAENASSDFANGKTNDIHGTMIAMSEADVRLRLLGAVRNRALEAYREIMRMGA